MGSQSQSHHSHIKHLASLNSSPNRPCMWVSFFFFFFFFLFFWGLTHTHYSIFSLCLVSKKIKGKKILVIVVCAVWALYCRVNVETFDLFSIGKEKEILGFVTYIVEVLVKMRDLLKVEPNGCLRLWLKSLISFIVIWLLRKFERIWECEKKNLGLMIYVLHVQDLCELRERPIPLFDLICLAFLCYFFCFFEV